MNDLMNMDRLMQWIALAREWLVTNVFVWENAVDVAVQIAALLLARIFGMVGGRWIRRTVENRWGGYRFRKVMLESFLRRLLQLTPMLMSILLLFVAIQVVAEFKFRTFLMILVLNLSAAWVVIQLATSAIPDRFWARIISVVAWTLATLNILGILDEVVSFLETFGFSVGDVNLTLLSVIKAAIILFVLMKVVNRLSKMLEKRLEAASELTPSSRLMVSKILHITMLVVVGMVALNSIGINLTALAVFSGAIGVGIGFGLQKVVGNFISGLILLSDKSIKPGDVVEMGGVYGWVNQMGGRCVSIVTRDEKEYLIPNEDLITQQVVNWSYSNRRIRLKVPVGISYKEDPHQTMELMLKAIEGLDRILAEPEPKCLLLGFGDSSVDLEIRFWIEDPQNGVSNVISDVLLRVWDAFKENGIEIPFPQRDVHLDGSAQMKVITGDETAAGKD